MTIENYLEEIIKIYNQLRESNEFFLIKNGGQDGFERLIAQRSVEMDTLDFLKEELVNELKYLKPQLELDSVDLPEVINSLPNVCPNLLGHKNRIIEALTKLLQSEKEVSESIKAIRNDIKEELSNIRKGNKTLDAYKPITGYSGSHFIDKKK